MEFILIIITAMLTSNVVLSQFLGMCSFVGVSNKVKNAVSMGAAVVFVIMLASAVCWPIYAYILVPADLTFMSTIVFILVIAVLVTIVAMFIKKFSPSLYKALGIYLPLITTNCAVLGVCNKNAASYATDFGSAMANAAGSCLGFLLVIFIFSCVRVRIEASDSPKAFKGLPIALVTAAIMALAFTGLTGIGAW